MYIGKKAEKEFKFVSQKALQAIIVFDAKRYNSKKMFKTIIIDH